MLKWLKTKLTKKKPETKTSSKKILIWDVLEGPIDADDLPDDLPDGHNFLNVCKAEIDGEIVHVNFWFETFDEAYEWVKHFQKAIEPIEVAHAGD